MPLARWKDLCTDTNEPDAAAAFWAAVLGLRRGPRDGPVTRLDGDRPQDTVWINEVPERRTVKDRVHLDLVGRVDDVLAAGGSLEGEQEAWHVVADPDRGLHCVFAEPPSALVIDAHDPLAQACWWAQVLGVEPTPAPDGAPRWLAVPGCPFDVWKFVGVPEPKTVKNRRHWDVECDDVPALLDRGATLLRSPDADIRWHVLADPEGNEFCAFAGG